MNTTNTQPTPAKRKATKVKKSVQVDEAIGGLLDVMLQKAGLSLDDLVNTSVRLWIVQNLDLLSAEDKKQFPHLKF